MQRLSLGLVALCAIAAAAALLPAPASADQNELRIGRGKPIGYLPLMVAEHNKLFEKHAAAAGIPDLKVSWQAFSGSNVAIDALLSGSTDIVASGATSLITLWSRTAKTNNPVRGVVALSALPVYLSTTNPNVKSIKDFTDKDRITMPAPKVSFQAMILQMAAAKEWGIKNYTRLDHLTIGRAAPDAMIALLSPMSETTADFNAPPYQNMELEKSGVHRVLSSYDVLEAPGTFALAYSSTKFHDANPKLYAAVIAALKEGAAIVAKDKGAAADAYIAISQDKNISRDLLMKILNDPDSQFDLTPKNMMKYAEFMKTTGTIPLMPSSWKDLFFPAIHDLSGS